MKKKNVVFLVIDSVFEKSTHATTYRNAPMPFFDCLREKSIVCPNMHSQAPFTEAAIMPLLTGNDLLDHGGYLQKFKYRKSMLEMFQDQGYDTFLNHYLPLIDPLHVFSGLTNFYYMCYVEPHQLWGYRFEHYAPLYNSGQLNDNEIEILLELLDSNFVVWIHILESIINKEEDTLLLRKNSKLHNVQGELEAVVDEYKSFQKDKNSYLKEVMHQGMNHQFFKIKTQELNAKASIDTKQWVRENYFSTYERIYKLNKRRNMRNNKLPFKQIIHAIKSRDIKSAKVYASMYKAAVYDKDLYDRIAEDYDEFKAAISMHSYIENGLAWIDHKKDSDNPFFLYLHVDDAHAPESIISYDSDDKELLKKEFELVNSYLDHLPRNFKGSLTQMLSYQYCDHCIKYLFDELEQRKLLDDTIVCITADHGFSYGYEVFRTSYVNNLFYENYNPIFCLYGKDIHPKIKDGYFDTKDIPSTLLDAAGCEHTEKMSGKSILKFEGRDYCRVEYMGGGCPDMLRRDIVLGVRTDNYNVVVNINIQQSFQERKIKEVYDLKKDPKEYMNLSSKIDEQKIAYELSIAEKRFLELKKDFK